MHTDIQALMGTEPPDFGLQSVEKQEIDGHSLIITL